MSAVARVRHMLVPRCSETLVEATPISGPALMWTPQSVSREMDDPTVLVMPTHSAPREIEYRSAISVSAVSPARTIGFPAAGTHPWPSAVLRARVRDRHVAHLLQQGARLLRQARPRA